jgi:nondiscriminating glutamyl-tRNA synthetase
LVVNNEEENIRVRFAPSPTGHLHLGGARTALYNWLFARSQGGVFVLRIEDTDLSRSTEAAVDQIISSLRWLGLDWDEGPHTGGPYGPYRQMERASLYADTAEKLLNAGKAYRCFCTEEELDLERDAAKKEGRAYVYGGRCRNLSEEAIAARLGEEKDAVIRLAAPASGQTVVRDLIHGDVAFDNALCGDFIIVRASGVPTYNFAAAVDDASMAITHVIRGDDHLPNTPKQIMVMEAMGEKTPSYAHLPLILGPDRSPLSKRHGAVAVGEFRSQGFVHEAMCNYLALLGWSFDDRTTLFSMESLVQKFSLERVGSTAAAFDREKLIWMNGHYIREMDETELAERLEEFIAGTKLAGMPGSDNLPELVDLVPLVKEKMKTLADFVTFTDFFFMPVEFEEKALEKLQSDALAPAALDVAATVLKELEPFTAESLEKQLRQVAEESDMKLGKFLQPVRIAVSGKLVTPGMFETLAVLGKEESLKRIEAARAMYSI